MDQLSDMLAQFGLTDCEFYRNYMTPGGYFYIKVLLNEHIDYGANCQQRFYNDLKSKILNSPEICDLKRSYENTIKDMEERIKEQEEAIMKLTDAIYNISLDKKPLAE